MVNRWATIMLGIGAYEILSALLEVHHSAFLGFTLISVAVLGVVVCAVVEVAHEKLSR